MPGAALSRWTMTYFAVALAFLVGGEGMMALGFGYPFADLADPRTLILVHAVVIGWLSLLMGGALLQFVPVLVAHPLVGGKLALPALLAVVLGLIALLCGFVGISKGNSLFAYDLPAAAVLLVSGFSLLVVILAATLWSARPLSLPARFVAIGLVALVATVALGASFALTLAGVSSSDIAVDVMLHGVSSHAMLGLGGWMTFTAIGVSYRLLTMFLLSPETARRSWHLVWWTGALALLLVASLAALSVFSPVSTRWVMPPAVALGLVALTAYGFDLLAIYRGRRRRAIELNSRISLWAFSALTAAGCLMIGLMVVGIMEHGVAALTYLTVFGWLSGLGLAQLYKIIPFLTWLECYGPVLGRTPTPRVQDLVAEGDGVLWFILYFSSVAVAAAALLLPWPDLFRLAALSQLAATLGLIREFAKARRLAHVSTKLRLPAGAIRPNLFLPHLPARRAP